MIASDTIRWHRHRITVTTWIGSLVLLCFSCAGMAQTRPVDETITLLWTERKPFQYADEQGKPAGLVVDIGNRVFARADLPVRSEMIPSNRVINLLKQNAQAACAVGWYKTEDREAIAHFSRPIYLDKALRGVFRADSDIAQGTPATAVFEDQTTRVLLKQGFAYGPTLDELISRKSPALLHRVTVDAPNLLQMVKAGRADVVLLAQEEIDYYGKAMPNFAKDFKVVIFSGLPDNDLRYIMCSKRVNEAMMNKLNNAIVATVKLR